MLSHRGSARHLRMRRNLRRTAYGPFVHSYGRVRRIYLSRPLRRDSPYFDALGRPGAYIRFYLQRIPRQYFANRNRFGRQTEVSEAERKIYRRSRYGGRREIIRSLRLPFCGKNAFFMRRSGFYPAKRHRSLSAFGRKLPRKGRSAACGKNRERSALGAYLPYRNGRGRRKGKRSILCGRPSRKTLCAA